MDELLSEHKEQPITVKFGLTIIDATCDKFDGKALITWKRGISQSTQGTTLSHQKKNDRWTFNHLLEFDTTFYPNVKGKGKKPYENKYIVFHFVNEDKDKKVAKSIVDLVDYIGKNQTEEFKFKSSKVGASKTIIMRLEINSDVIKIGKRKVVNEDGVYSLGDADDEEFVEKTEVDWSEEKSAMIDDDSEISKGEGGSTKKSKKRFSKKLSKIFQKDTKEESAEPESKESKSEKSEKRKSKKK